MGKTADFKGWFNPAIKSRDKFNLIAGYISIFLPEQGFLLTKNGQAGSRRTVVCRITDNPGKKCPYRKNNAS